MLNYQRVSSFSLLIDVAFRGSIPHFQTQPRLSNFFTGHIHIWDPNKEALILVERIIYKTPILLR
jgi:hypothetical protein